MWGTGLIFPWLFGAFRSHQTPALRHVMYLIHIQTLTGAPVQILWQTSSIQKILNVENLYWRTEILWPSQTALNSLWTFTLNLPASLHRCQVHLHLYNCAWFIHSHSTDFFNILLLWWPFHSPASSNCLPLDISNIKNKWSSTPSHTQRPSQAACSAWVQHLRYAEDINLHSYTWPTTKMNPYHTWITSLSVHSHFKHAALISILYQTGVYIQSKETPSVFSHQMVRKGRKFYCSSVRLFVLAFVTVKWLLPWGRRFLFTLSHYFLSQERDESNLYRCLYGFYMIWFSV